MDKLKLILTEEVENLGQVGEEVEVADGYGRNYLLPKGLAVRPTEASKKRFEKVRRGRKKKIAQRREWAEGAVEELDGLAVEIERKAQPESETLYGSVRKEDIISLVDEAVDIELNPDQIDLPKPIEKVGKFEIPLKLYEELRATLKLNVNPEEPEENPEKNEEK